MLCKIQNTRQVKFKSNHSKKSECRNFRHSDFSLTLFSIYFCLFMEPEQFSFSRSKSNPINLILFFPVPNFLLNNMFRRVIFNITMRQNKKFCYEYNLQTEEKPCMKLFSSVPVSPRMIWFINVFFQMRLLSFVSPGARTSIIPYFPKNKNISRFKSHETKRSLMTFSQPPQDRVNFLSRPVTGPWSHCSYCL